MYLLFAHFSSFDPVLYSRKTSRCYRSDVRGFSSAQVYRMHLEWTRLAYKSQNRQNRSKVIFQNYKRRGFVNGLGWFDKQRYPLELKAYQTQKQGGKREHTSEVVILDPCNDCPIPLLLANSFDHVMFCILHNSNSPLQLQKETPTDGSNDKELFLCQKVRRL